MKVKFSNHNHMLNVHNVAVDGFGETNVDRYNRGRPDYSFETVAQVGNILSGVVSTNPIVLELGAGTGKFTKSFLKQEVQFANSWNFKTENYIASEPSTAFRRNLEKSIPLIKTIEATGHRIPLANQSVDCVIAAQAFHWMATQDTLQEVYRVLRQNCPLVMVWNSVDRSIPWLKELELSVLSPLYDRDTPRYITGEWENCFKQPPGRRLFGPLQRWTARTTYIVTEDDVVDRFLSVSVAARLPDDERRTIEENIRQLVRDNHSASTLRENKIPLEYINDVVWAYSRVN